MRAVVALIVWLAFTGLVRAEQFLGVRPLNSTVMIDVNTFDPNTGAPADADSPPTYRIYEAGSGTPIVTGNFSLTDSSNTDGFYTGSFVASAANGFEVDAAYIVRIAGTVGGQTGATTRYVQIGGVELTTDALQDIETELDERFVAVGTWVGEAVSSINAYTQEQVADTLDDSLDINDPNSLFGRVVQVYSQLPADPNQLIAAQEDLDALAEEVAGIQPAPEVRDLLPLQHVWTLPSRAGASTASTQHLRMTPGEGPLRAGFDCDAALGLRVNAGTVLAEIDDVELLTPSDDVTVTALGIDARYAKILVTVAADAAAGEHWVRVRVRASAGGWVTLFGKVIVVAEPE